MIIPVVNRLPNWTAVESGCRHRFGFTGVCDPHDKRNQLIFSTSWSLVHQCRPVTAELEAVPRRLWCARIQMYVCVVLYVRCYVSVSQPRPDPLWPLSTTATSTSGWRPLADWPTSVAAQIAQPTASNPMQNACMLYYARWHCCNRSPITRMCLWLQKVDTQMVLWVSSEWHK